MSKMKARRGRRARLFFGGGLPRAARLGLVGLRAVSRGRLEAARETRPGREASRVHLHAIAAAGARGEELGGGWGVGVRRAPVNPPSPAFRGLRATVGTERRAAGPLALFVGLRSRRNVTSLKRGAAFAASTGVEQARGSRATMRLLCVCERVRLRDLWFLATKPEAPTCHSVRFFVLVVLRARPE